MLSKLPISAHYPPEALRRMNAEGATSNFHEYALIVEYSIAPLTSKVIIELKTIWNTTP
jgi:hypothetical protein